MQDGEQEQTHEMAQGGGVCLIKTPSSDKLSAQDRPEPSGGSPSDQTYRSSPPSTPPLRPEEIDRWQSHIGLRQFGEKLQAAADAVFPNTPWSRYRSIYVLMMKWKDEDPNLPVSYEISRLSEIFEKVYGFETEIWDIPDEECHPETNQRVLDFSRLGGNSKEDLKIVYYAGHGKLTKNRLLSWTSWRNNQASDCPTVKWSGIQNVLEESRSDVLLLLDCCHAGTANTNEGQGVTELISACAFNSRANGVGPYSFTNALVIELLDLAKKPSFSVGELYSSIFCRIQGRMPEDGRERHPAPVHLVLSNGGKYGRSIQISARPRIENSRDVQMHEAYSNSQTGAHGTEVDPNSHVDEPTETSAPLAKIPRLAIAIRLRENFLVSDLSADYFVEWLRSMPVVAEQVKVEAGFDSFSSILILSIPVSMTAYLETDSAMVQIGIITSSNRMSNRSQDKIKPGESDQLAFKSHNTISSQVPSQPNFPSQSKPAGQKRKANIMENATHLELLEDFGAKLLDAADAIFQNERVTKYSNVSCILLTWDDEEADIFARNLNVLAKVLANDYRFNVEQYQLASFQEDYQVEKKLNNFLGDGDPTVLKIVYYKTPSNGNVKELPGGRVVYRQVQNLNWLEVQRRLEMSYSDVLILLESPVAEMWTSDKCNGITEMIAACSTTYPRPKKESRYFIRSLIEALRRLEPLPSFTVRYLYQVILDEVELITHDSRFKQSIIHQVMTHDDSHKESIRLSGGLRPMLQTLDRNILAAGSLTATHSSTGAENYQEGSRAWLVPPQKTSSTGPRLSAVDAEARLLFSIRVREEVVPEDFSTDDFYNWLREIPIPTDLVRFESVCVN